MVLLPIPFTDLSSSKVRPAVVVVMLDELAKAITAKAVEVFERGGGK